MIRVVASSKCSVSWGAAWKTACEKIKTALSEEAKECLWTNLTEGHSRYTETWYTGTVYRAWKRLPEWIHPFLWCIMIRVIFFYRFFMIQVILIQITPKGTHPKFSGGQFSALSRDSLRCYGTRVNVLTREKTTVIRLLSPGEVAIHVNLAPSCYRNRDKQSAANFINWLIWQPNKERCNFTFVKTTVQSGRGMNEWIDWTP